jgi:glycosyltransferase involved in cell wall biosynthesis
MMATLELSKEMKNSLLDGAKILYVAPLRDFSGYAHAARDYVLSLDALGLNLVTRDVIYDGGQYKRNVAEDALANKDVQGVDIIIQHTTPNETEYKDDVFNVNIFCWETDTVPPEWVNQLNQMDLILVSCDENIKACKRSGVIVPVEKVHFAVDVEKYKKKIKPFETPGLSNSFKFLAICQYSKKKGVDALLKAYLSEFTKEDNVLLILKTYVGPQDGPEQKERVQNIIKAMKSILRLNDYPPIQLIHEVMDDEQVARLYATADCYALPSRGEGWGIPHFDALGYGLPAIATAWAGPTEFITPKCGWLIPYNMSPVCDMPHPFPYLYTAKENWAEPHVNKLKEAMRDAYALHSASKRTDEKTEWNRMVDNAKDRAKDFSYEVIGPELRDTIGKYYSRWKADREN